MDSVQPALVVQLFNRQPGELYAVAVEVVERCIRSRRPDHDGRAIDHATKPLFALAQRLLQTRMSLSPDQQSDQGRRLDRDDDQKNGDDVCHRG
jgi:hypothetical protein